MVTASRLFLVYLVVETAALVALIMTIGFGWTALLFAATFTAGVLLAGRQVGRQVRQLRAGRTQGALGDSALTGLGALLVAVPGLVTTAAGLLLLLPVTRPAVRPVVTGLATVGLSRRTPQVRTAAPGAHHYPPRSHAAPAGDYIDGEVISVVDGAVP